MKNPRYLLAAGFLLLPSWPLLAQRAEPPLNVAIAGVAEIEAPTSQGGTRAIGLPITAALLFQELHVNQGKTPDYALIFDELHRQVVLRAIKASANLPDKVLLDFSSTATTDAEVDTTSAHSRLVFTQNIAAGPDAAGTIFAGLQGVALVSVYTPPGFPYPYPDRSLFRITAKGTNPTANAANPDAILLFRVATGTQFTQKP